MFLVYRFFTIVFYPLLIILIFFRKILKKENNRYKEKIFKRNILKNELKEDSVIWFHAASIGEITSIIPLIHLMIKEKSKIKIIVTTITVSSSEIVKNEFKENKNVIHHFLPLDVPHLVKDFIYKCNPSLIVFVDSEIWPNFIFQIKKNKIPFVLINGRITKKTFNRWSMFRKFANENFSAFNLCLAANNESADHLRVLGAQNVIFIGNLKFTFNKNRLNNEEFISNDGFKNRKIWLCASTHDDEELFCMETHREIRKVHKNVITIIAPRHINRINKIFKQSQKYSFHTQVVKNFSSPINKDTEIILINAFGILKNYYNCCNSVFIGKSTLKELISNAGQNPIEAAKFGCKIYSGPYVYNFREIYEYLEKINCAEKINNFKELAEKINLDFKKNMKEKSNLSKIENYGEEILKQTYNELKKINKNEI